MSDIALLLRKLSGIDDKAPTPPQTNDEDRSMKHFYLIIAATVAMILFGVVVAFVGFF